jgi:hypothetical protein
MGEGESAAMESPFHIMNAVLMMNAKLSNCSIKLRGDMDPIITRDLERRIWCWVRSGNGRRMVESLELRDHVEVDTTRISDGRSFRLKLSKKCEEFTERFKWGLPQLNL